MNRLIRALYCAAFVIVAAGCGEDAAEPAAGGPPAAEDAPPPGVRVSAVDTGRVERTIAFTGEVLADHRVELAPLESGRLDTLTVDVGDTVVAGEVIATLDEAVQRTTRDERRRDVQTASAQVEVARAELEAHRADLDRRRTLADRGAFTRSELDALEERTAVLQANIDLAETREATARTRLAAVDAILDRRSVRAPFDGTVVERHVVAGATVSPQTPLVTVVDPATLEFVGRVPERALAEIEVGHATRVTIDALGPEPIEGAITRLGRDVDRDSRTVEVRVRLDDAAGHDRLLHGMFGRGQIILEQSEGTRIPVEALGRGPEGGSVVWLIDDASTARRVPVEIGLDDGVFATTTAVAPGARVVLRPPRGLEDGGAVVVVGAPAADEGSGGPGGPR